jgi:hypothetical protein
MIIARDKHAYRDLLLAAFVGGVAGAFFWSALEDLLLIRVQVSWLRSAAGLPQLPYTAGNELDSWMGGMTSRWYLVVAGWVVALSWLNLPKGKWTRIAAAAGAVALIWIGEVLVRQPWTYGGPPFGPSAPWISSTMWLAELSSFFTLTVCMAFLAESILKKAERA